VRKMRHLLLYIIKHSRIASMMRMLRNVVAAVGHGAVGTIPTLTATAAITSL
jgi:hypothetical protein